MSNEEMDADVKFQMFLDEQEYPTGVRGGCQHRVGVAGGGVELKPEDSPIDGSAMLRVHMDRVEMWVCPSPWGHNNWRRYSTQYYKSPEELRDILDTHTGRKVNAGCWG